MSFKEFWDVPFLCFVPGLYRHGNHIWVSIFWFSDVSISEADAKKRPKRRKPGPPKVSIVRFLRSAGLVEKVSFMRYGGVAAVVLDMAPLSVLYGRRWRMLGNCWQVQVSDVSDWVAEHGVALWCKFPGGSRLVSLHHSDCTLSDRRTPHPVKNRTHFPEISACQFSQAFASAELRKKQGRFRGIAPKQKAFLANKSVRMLFCKWSCWSGGKWKKEGKLPNRDPLPVSISTTACDDLVTFELLFRSHWEMRHRSNNCCPEDKESHTIHF